MVNSHLLYQLSYRGTRATAENTAGPGGCQLRLGSGPRGGGARAAQGNRREHRRKEGSGTGKTRYRSRWQIRVPRRTTQNRPSPGCAVGRGGSAPTVGWGADAPGEWPRSGPVRRPPRLPWVLRNPAFRPGFHAPDFLLSPLPGSNNCRTRPCRCSYYATSPGDATFSFLPAPARFEP